MDYKDCFGHRTTIAGISTSKRLYIKKYCWFQETGLVSIFNDSVYKERERNLIDNTVTDVCIKYQQFWAWNYNPTWIDESYAVTTENHS